VQVLPIAYPHLAKTHGNDHVFSRVDTGDRIDVATMLETSVSDEDVIMKETEMTLSQVRLYVGLFNTVILKLIR
jgi:hypothetical protein